MVAQHDIVDEVCDDNLYNIGSEKLEEGNYINLMTIEAEGDIILEKEILNSVLIKAKIMQEEIKSKERDVPKKLRVVLQERKVASLNNLIYIEPFSLSILVHLVYLNLSWSVSTYLGSSRSILVQLGLPFSIYFGLFRAILSYRRLFWTKIGYLGLSWSSWVYRSLFILVYFGLY